MAKRTNQFPNLIKLCETNLLKIAGASFLLWCAGPQTVLADTFEKAAVTITQQQVQVTGSVVDGFGEPLIGVSVRVKGTLNGAITDLNGHFSLNAMKGEILEISYIGYVTVMVKAGDAPLKITMKEDSQQLDEVVVLGYGTTTKRAMISSVSTVKAEEMNNLPISNITQGLAGRAPGLIVQGSGGGINKTSSISIRGGDTPLIVIDGVIRDYSDFVALNPEDVCLERCFSNCGLWCACHQWYSSDND